jgi:hypothetical protein
VVHSPRESVSAIREAGADPATLARVTFLSLSGQPEQIAKTVFMGGTEACSLFRSSSPRPHTAHVFQKYLDDGSLVTVALRDYGGHPPQLTADVLRAISETFSRQ